MKRLFRWILIIVLVAVGMAGWLFWGRESSGPLAPTGQQTGTTATAITTATVTIRPADSVIGRVSAAGNIALSSERYVVMQVDGMVNQVEVRPGDVVAAGDLLLSLDTTDLERAVRRAELSFATSQNSLAQLQQPASADEIAQAEAELAAAKENLADVQAGASDAEIAAARASVAAGWAEYTDLTNGLTEAEKTQQAAQLRTAEAELQRAQRAYDKIRWRADIGATQESEDLQAATIEYERVKAEYEIAVAPSEADTQSAVSQAREAEQQLNDLLAQPTAAQVAEAKAQVAGARATLEDLKRGADALEIEAAQLAVQEALVELEEAHSQRQQAQVVAPMAGTVMEVSAEPGQRLGAGEVVVVLADAGQLELPVLVAEVDIDQVTVGQEAEITIDALLGRTFQGEVARIAPASEGTEGVINYQVTIQLTDADQTGVRPDMTAVAELVNTQASAGWLVPTTALRQSEGETVVTVVRNGQPQPVAVTPGGIQGEWAVVQSADLQAGDAVVGSVASYVGDDMAGFGGGGPPGGPPGGSDE